jgi:hypothetical protein
MPLGQTFACAYHVHLPFLQSLICAMNDNTRTYVLCQGLKNRLFEGNPAKKRLVDDRMRLVEYFICVKRIIANEVEYFAPSALTGTCPIFKTKWGRKNTTPR